MSTESFPAQLKEWVAFCLGQVTDSNRAEVHAELKKVIDDAFASQTIWTTDWFGIQLQSLLPKPNLSNLKRKLNDSPQVGKKGKKASAKNLAAPLPSAAPPLYPSSDPHEQLALSRRAQRFKREHDLERQKNDLFHGIHGGQTSSKAHNLQNAHLFNRSPRSGSPFPSSADDPEADPNVPNWDRHTIVGTSHEIFKDYLRLTSEPRPEMIRPYPVLQQTLLELKKRWREKAPYNWICSQFKSLRQDLTVQRIKNEFTIQVYEIHARMALECSDMVEYNQCQATLKSLYELGIPGGRVEEFTAYRILMLLHGRNKSDLNLFVGQLTSKQKESPAVQHALNVQRAMSMGNYHALFDLYVSAPNMGAYIMDHFVERERVRALMIMTKAYRTISLSFIHQELAFDSLALAREFLVNHSAAFFTDPASPDADKILECRPAFPTLSQAYTEKYRKVNIKGAI